MTKKLGCATCQGWLGRYRQPRNAWNRAYLCRLLTRMFQSLPRQSYDLNPNPLHLYQLLILSIEAWCRSSAQAAIPSWKCSQIKRSETRSCWIRSSAASHTLSTTAGSLRFLALHSRSSRWSVLYLAWNRDGLPQCASMPSLSCNNRRAWLTSGNKRGKTQWCYS